MTATAALPRETVAEEIANGVTHGVGLLLSIAGLAVLAGCASAFGDAWHVVSCSVYGATGVLMYAASTLYHSIPVPRARAVLRVLDHCAIFLLIAGTYTPFALVNLRGPWGWSILVAVWGLAALGIAARARRSRRSRLLATALYLGMGWAVVVAIRPLLHSVAPGGLLLLAGGGLAYTAGTVFYLWRGLRFHHAIWHLFVLAGSGLHFFAVLFYVIPLAR